MKKSGCSGTEHVKQKLLSVFVTVLLLLLCDNLVSANTINKAHVRESDIKIIERDLNQEKVSRNEAIRNKESASEKAKAIQKIILETGKDITLREQNIVILETSLDVLKGRNSQLSQSLQDKEKELQTVLLALQRLAIRPHGSLIIQPLAPNNAIRSGLILSATIPTLRNKAIALEKQLSELFSTRKKISIQQATLILNRQALIEKSDRLKSLFRQRKKTENKFNKEALNAEERIKDLAKEARDLRELLDQIISQKKSWQTAKRGLEKNYVYYPKYTDPEPSAVFEKKPLEHIKRRFFSKPSGMAPFPVTGNIIKRYGERVSDTESSKGIIIATRANAQVVSSFNGVVAFSGKFRGYGELLILEHNQGYHTLISGMKKIRSGVGTFVLAGEPLGNMPNRGASSLYWELRRNSQPINPLPWFGSQHKRE